MEYKKIIERTPTGLVIGEVFHGDRRVGLKFFTKWFWESESKPFIDAHEWADNLIDTCEKYEELE